MSTAVSLPVVIERHVCDQCGLCCKHLIPEAYAIDVLREPRIQDRLPLKPHHKTVADKCWVMYSPDLRQCPFLGEGNNCEIYATRPTCCVGFMAGSEKCQELRREHGLPELPKTQVGATVINRIAAECEEDEEWE